MSRRFQRVRRVLRVAPALLLTSLSFAAGGCRTLRPPPTFPELDTPLQALWRIDYGGPAGQGAARLTLRLWTPEDFLLEVRDPLGRLRWSARSAPEGTWVLEAEAGRFCRPGPRTALAPVGWGETPLWILPRVLLGRAPVENVRPGDAAVTTADGRWGFDWQRGELVRWSLWRDGEPVLWWLREPGGGVLSGARGDHLRWRERAREELTGAPASVSPPKGSVEIACDTLALP